MLLKGRVDVGILVIVPTRRAKHDGCVCLIFASARVAVWSPGFWGERDQTLFDPAARDAKEIALDAVEDVGRDEHNRAFGTREKSLHLRIIG